MRVVLRKMDGREMGTGVKEEEEVGDVEDGMSSGGHDDSGDDHRGLVMMIIMRWGLVMMMVMRWCGDDKWCGGGGSDGDDDVEDGDDERR